MGGLGHGVNSACRDLLEDRETGRGLAAKAQIQAATDHQRKVPQ